MVLQVYDIQNKVMLEGNVEDNNVSYELTYDEMNGVLKGRFNLFSVPLSQQEYMKLLSGLSKRTIAYFKVENQLTNSTILVSGLFVRDFSIQMVSGAVQLRMQLEVSDEQLAQFEQFLAMFNK